MPAGRPVVWTPEKRQEAIDKIFGRIATSRDSIRTICNGDDSLPTAETFFAWLGKDEELANQYTRVKESQAEVLGEEMLDISDDGKNDYMEKLGPDGSTAYVLNGEHVQRSRLRIETRKWLMGKLRPKKYGDLVRQEITGKDGGAVEIKLTKMDEGL